LLVLISYGDISLKILVTNDDGISSPGLWAAVEALKEAGEIFVVAPDREQSGVGTSLTLHVPIRASKVSPQVSGGVNGITSYSVEGTPGDSCVLALERLVGPVDLVVSGINQGSNLGQDVLISGTVGAAFQGYFRGYPSVAISVGAIKDVRYEVAAAFLKILAGRLLEGATLPPALINVNIPNEPLEKIEGVRITHLGGRSYGESVTSGTDGRREYYWVARNKPIHQPQDENTDIWALRHNQISITPIHSGLTDVEKIPIIEDLFKERVDNLLSQRD
jgi:5'-nucleotidase